MFQTKVIDNKAYAHDYNSADSVLQLKVDEIGSDLQSEPLIRSSDFDLENKDKDRIVQGIVDKNKPGDEPSAPVHEADTDVEDLAGSTNTAKHEGDSTRNDATTAIFGACAAAEQSSNAAAQAASKALVSSGSCLRSMIANEAVEKNFLSRTLAADMMKHCKESVEMAREKNTGQRIEDRDRDTWWLMRTCKEAASGWRKHSKAPVMISHTCLIAATVAKEVAENHHDTELSSIVDIVSKGILLPSMRLTESDVQSEMVRRYKSDEADYFSNREAIEKLVLHNAAVATRITVDTLRLIYGSRLENDHVVLVDQPPRVEMDLALLPPLAKVAADIVLAARDSCLTVFDVGETAAAAAAAFAKKNNGTQDQIAKFASEAVITVMITEGGSALDAAITAAMASEAAGGSIARAAGYAAGAVAKLGGASAAIAGQAASDAVKRLSCGNEVTFCGYKDGSRGIEANEQFAASKLAQVSWEDESEDADFQNIYEKEKENAAGFQMIYQKEKGRSDLEKSIQKEKENAAAEFLSERAIADLLNSERLLEAKCLDEHALVHKKSKRKSKKKKKKNPRCNKNKDQEQAEQKMLDEQKRQQQSAEARDRHTNEVREKLTRDAKQRREDGEEVLRKMHEEEKLRKEEVAKEEKLKKEEVVKEEKLKKEEVVKEEKLKKKKVAIRAVVLQKLGLKDQHNEQERQKVDAKKYSALQQQCEYLENYLENILRQVTQERDEFSRFRHQAKQKEAEATKRTHTATQERDKSYDEYSRFRHQTEQKEAEAINRLEMLFPGIGCGTEGDLVQMINSACGILESQGVTQPVMKTPIRSGSSASGNSSSSFWDETDLGLSPTGIAAVSAKSASPPHSSHRTYSRSKSYGFVADEKPPLSPTAKPWHQGQEKANRDELTYDELTYGETGKKKEAESPPSPRLSNDRNDWGVKSGFTVDEKQALSDEEEKEERYSWGSERKVWRDTDYAQSSYLQTQAPHSPNAPNCADSIYDPSTKR